MVNYEFARKEAVDQDVSPFMRKGDWQSHFTGEQNVFYDEMLKEKMDGTGLKFTYQM